MAVTGAANEGNGPVKYSQSPQNYVSLGDLVDGTKDDVRDLYVSAYGDQGLSGLVEIIGAKKNVGTSDETVWYEEGRLGRRVTLNGSNQVTKIDATGATAENDAVRQYDVLLKGDKRYLVTNEVTASTTSLSLTDMSDGSGSATAATGEYTVIGNAFPQGSNQPSKPFSPRLTRYANPFIIVKETFHVSGSQASNIGWVNVGGQNMWYLKGELDARRKFMNMREGMLVFGQKNAAAGGAYGSDVPGSEGYVAAVEARGGTATNPWAADFNGSGGFDEVIIEIDKQGAPAESALYLNRDLSLKCDNQIAAAGLGGTGIGLSAAFGAFQNNKDMAVAMGFKSFTRGGYTFHKHDWKLLNDPAAGGTSDVKGALIPLSVIVDAKTGNSHHSLEMNYKSAGNYSREMEHWVEGGGVLGYNTGGEDLAKFNYRSECNLCVRGANQHFLFT